MLTEREIARRFPVWDAMSDLFLDTELGEADHRHIAEKVLESGYGPEEINRILWREVFPGVGDNLRCVAGEWAGFNSEWLRGRMLAVLESEDRSLGKGGILSVETLIKITKTEWLKVCSYLPPEYSLANEVLAASDKPKSLSRLKFW